MAKRFTDNEKWKKKFFRKLSQQHKLLWIYILDDCNHAGIWDVDLEVAEVRIGFHSFLQGECEDIFKERIVIFQNGTLNPNSRVHQSVINLLEKYNLYQPAKELQYIEAADTKRFKKPIIAEVKTYCDERKNNVDAQRFIDFYESKGWKVGKNPMKDWRACVRTWEKNNKQQEKTAQRTNNNKIDKNLQTWINVKKLLK